MQQEHQDAQTLLTYIPVDNSGKFPRTDSKINNQVSKMILKLEVIEIITIITVRLINRTVHTNHHLVDTTNSQIMISTDINGLNTRAILNLIQIIIVETTTQDKMITTTKLNIRIMISN